MINQEEKKALLSAGRTSLIDYSILINNRYIPSWHHELIADKLEQVYSGRIKRLMLFLPPRSGKTTLATIHFPSWVLGLREKQEFITASYSGELAQKFGKETRNVVSSPIYKEMFGVTLKQGDKNKSQWSTTNGGSYTSVGVGGATTGKGANFISIDDPIRNRAEAESKLYRDRIWDWYRSTIYTRLEKNGAIVLTLTRWHNDDLAGRLIKDQEDGGDQWDIISFPAIATSTEKIKVGKKHIVRKVGSPLWKDKYGKDVLKQIKNTIGSYEWAALYQQNPVSAETQVFKPDWFKYRTLEEVLRLNTRNFVSVDTAISQKASADYTAITINYVDRENNWNIQSMHLRCTPTELLDLLFKIHSERRIEKIGIEKTIYLQAIKEFFDQEMRKRNKFMEIVELQHNQIAKEVRIRGLIPRYETGSIYHIKGECDGLEDELLSFPKGANDDEVDSLAYQDQIAEVGFKGVENKIYHFTNSTY